MNASAFEREAAEARSRMNVIGWLFALLLIWAVATTGLLVASCSSSPADHTQTAAPAR